jgi:hypothetical protein
MKEVPDNMVLLQRTNGKASHAACVDGSEWHGFLFTKHPDGNWVSTQKLTDREITQVEDQRDSGSVIEHCTVRA